jgi:hypothetical protein
MLDYVFGKTTSNPGFVAPHNRLVHNYHKSAALYAHGGLGMIAGKAMARFGLKKTLHPQNGLDIEGVFMPTDFEGDDATIKAAVRYEATRVAQFHYIIRKLDFDPARYTFIDYGSGKGAALFMAAEYPFRSILGIELSASLHTSAQANIEAFTSSHPDATTPLAMCENAATFQPPSGPLVIYLFNPFGPEVLRPALKNIETVAQRQDDPCYIIYNNAVHADLIAQSEVFRPVAQPFGGLWSLFRS